jgi:hypothetical protein
MPIACRLHDKVWFRCSVDSAPNRAPVENREARLVICNRQTDRRIYLTLLSSGAPSSGLNLMLIRNRLIYQHSSLNLASRRLASLSLGLRSQIEPGRAQAPSSISRINLKSNSTFTTRRLSKMPHATEFTPQEYPPFPTSPEFKTVNLQTISLKKLLSEDATEQDRVFEACKTRGFFYLELGGCESGETILKGADDICRMAEDVFKLPMEVKEEQRMREGQLDG